MPTAPEDDEFPLVGGFARYAIPIDPATQQLRIIGEGGMSRVYKAEDKTLARIVAVKVLSAGADEAAKLRFRREARAMAKLNHPTIPILFDYGREGGNEFYAMEWIAGEELEARVKRAAVLSVEDALRYIEQAARALGAVHRAGIVHRDVKPSNIMLTRTGHGGAETVKLIDFGLAKGIAGATDFEVEAGFTPLFASPEQFLQSPATPQSDLYSLGATLWFLLVGRPPFTGTSLYEVQKKHLEAPLPFDSLPEGMPAGVKELLLELLAKAPEERPKTADDVASRIAQIRERATAEGNLPHLPNTVEIEQGRFEENEPAKRRPEDEAYTEKSIAARDALLASDAQRSREMRRKGLRAVIWVAPVFAVFFAISVLDFWHSPLANWMKIALEIALVLFVALFASLLQSHRPSYRELRTSDLSARFDPIIKPMNPSDFIAGITAAFTGIQTWIQFRDSQRAAAEFDRQYRQTSDEPTTDSRGKALAAIVPADVMDDMIRRARNCWEKFRNVLNNPDDFLPDEVDQATKAVKKCICRELGRIVELNGHIPDKQLADQWAKYCDV